MSGHCNICGRWGCVESSCPQARPGSDTAREHGCTCSVHIVLDSGTLYNYNFDCPLHGEPQEA